MESQDPGSTRSILIIKPNYLVLVQEKVKEILQTSLTHLLDQENMILKLLDLKVMDLVAELNLIKMVALLHRIPDQELTIKNYQVKQKMFLLENNLKVKQLKKNQGSNQAQVCIIKICLLIKSLLLEQAQLEHLIDLAQVQMKMFQVLVLMRSHQQSRMVQSFL